MSRRPGPGGVSPDVLPGTRAEPASSRCRDLDAARSCRDAWTTGRPPRCPDQAPIPADLQLFRGIELGLLPTPRVARHRLEEPAALDRDQPQRRARRDACRSRHVAQQCDLAEAVAGTPVREVRAGQGDLDAALGQDVVAIPWITLADDDGAIGNVEPRELGEDAFDRRRGERREDRQVPQQRKGSRIGWPGVAVERPELGPGHREHDRDEEAGDEEGPAHAERLDEDPARDGPDRQGEHRQAFQDPEHAGQHGLRRDPLEERPAGDRGHAEAGTARGEQDRSGHDRWGDPDHRDRNPNSAPLPASDGVSRRRPTSVTVIIAPATPPSPKAA